VATAKLDHLAGEPGQVGPIATHCPSRLCGRRASSVSRASVLSAVSGGSPTPSARPAAIVSQRCVCRGERRGQPAGRSSDTSR
jgi:hypothetical protein